MDTPEYERRAALTAPEGTVMHLGMVPPTALYGILTRLRAYEPDINACKKLLVYGPKAPEGITDELARYESDPEATHFNAGTNFSDAVAHGIIGVVSETLELGDNLLTTLFGGDELDTQNIKEEVGDILWYLARLARACDFTLSEAMEANIAKLEVRHLNKTGGFNPEAGLEENRDREAEQAAARSAAARSQKETTMDDQANLGLATNEELETELRVRKELGHTDPNYRTVDASPEVQKQVNYRGDELGEKQPASEPTRHTPE